MKKILITALIVLSASVSLIHAAAGWWRDATAPIYDFSTDAIIKTWYASEVRGETTIRMGSIQFKSVKADELLELTGNDVYLVDKKWNKKYLTMFKKQEDGIYGYTYQVLPSLILAPQYNEIVFMKYTKCRIYDSLEKQKTCDKTTRLPFNSLASRYKAIWIKFPDGTTKEIKFKFSHQDTVNELYKSVNGTGN
jgi:hypothetical protein